MLKDYKQIKKGKGDGKGKDGKGGRKGDGPPAPTKRRQMPDDEFKALTAMDTTNPKDRKKRICRWWNCSLGCDRTDNDCAYAHGICLLCKGSHKWIHCKKRS